MTTKPPPKYEPNKVGDNSATVDIDVFPNTDEEEKAKDETCSHGSMDGASRVVQRQLKQRHISMIAMAGM
jgi:amino acid permease